MEWIKVSERLPDHQPENHSEICLCTNINDDKFDLFSAFYDGEYESWRKYPSMDLCKVSHWTFRLEPPKDEPAIAKCPPLANDDWRFFRMSEEK